MTPKLTQLDPGDLNPVDPATLNSEDSRRTEKRIRMRIPKTLHQEPVISKLVSHYGLTVNITAAILGSNANGDGWFDLDLKGSHDRIANALAYLNELDLELWQGSDRDGW
jgi:ABC-type methionine transport system ATPase subunit